MCYNAVLCLVYHRLEGALKGAMVDLSKRMQEIKETLDATVAATEDAEEMTGSRGSAMQDVRDQEVTSGTNNRNAIASLEESERLLEELLDLVESVDQARDLSTIGGLETLLMLLRSNQPSLQWRAAEIAGACVQNTPTIQEAFMQGGILPAIWPLLDHSNIQCRIKGMFALSCMSRGYAAAMKWVVDAHGVQKTIDMMDPQKSPDFNLNQQRPDDSRDVEKLIDHRLLRKCLQFLGYMMRVAPRERQHAISHENGILLQRIVDSLTWSQDVAIRTAALELSMVLVQDPMCAEKMQRNESFIHAIQNLLFRLDSLEKEEWPGVEEEVLLGKALLSKLSKQIESNPCSNSNDSPEAADVSNMQLLPVSKSDGRN